MNLIHTIKAVLTSALLTSLLFLPAVAVAEAFWVLGSFSDESQAVAEGKRISGESGVEVLMYEVISDSSVSYRLLTSIFDEESDDASLRYQLEQSGVVDPWTIRFDDDRPYMQSIFADIEGLDDYLGEYDDDFSDYDLGGDFGDDLGDLDSGISGYGSGVSTTITGSYVVVGSFSDALKAQILAEQFDTTAIGVSEAIVVPTDVNGRDFHRVALGPVASAEESNVMSLFAGMGYPDSWVMRGVESVAALVPAPDRSAATVERSASDVPATPVVPRINIPDPTAIEDSDYNLARLRAK